MSNINLSLDSEDLARDYERQSADRQFKSGQALIDAIGIKPGDNVLDVGTGTGLLAAHVAELVGPRGHVIGIDPLELRIAMADGKARPNLEFAVGNAQDLAAYGSARFDVVYLNSVFHWLPDQLAALNEFRRVLKPGGRLGISTGSGDHPYVLQLIKARLMAREPYCRYPGKTTGNPKNPTRQEIELLLDQAGFEIQTIELRPSTNIAPDAFSLIDFFEASAFGNFLGNLPADLREAARQEVAQELEAMRTDAGICMELMRLLVVAVKPAAGV